MSSYSTRRLDFYDDEGALLSKAIPSSAELPDFVKVASEVTQDAHTNQFALVMVEDGSILKKYATADKGNTWLSTLYFALTKDQLPEEAQKVAAANLVEACEAFDIEAPDVLFACSDGPVESNIVEVGAPKPIMQKAASSTRREDVPYAIERADGSSYYPLRDSEDVSVAQEYFSRNAGDFVPRERREFALKTAAVAKKEGVPIAPAIEKYAGEGWNPQVEGHLTSRYLHLTNADFGMDAKDELMKLARSRDLFEPEEYAQALETFDTAFGLDALWDRDLADPWYAVTGSMVKVAKGTPAKPAERWDLGDVIVTEHDIIDLSREGKVSVSASMGDAFSNEFLQNPVKKFKSLPLSTKRFIARLALSNSEARTSG